MVRHQNLGAVARSILDSNLYMTLATADESGRPWASPVYYAANGYEEFFWVSAPDATHSRNLEARPEVSIVVFDSRAEIGTGQGVYLAARAEQLDGRELERGIEIYSRRSLSHGGNAWRREDVEPPDVFRLYRALVSEISLLDPGSRPNRRRPVSLRT